MTYQILDNLVYSAQRFINDGEFQRAEELCEIIDKFNTKELLPVELIVLKRNVSDLKETIRKSPLAEIKKIIAKPEPVQRDIPQDITPVYWKKSHLLAASAGGIACVYCFPIVSSCIIMAAVAYRYFLNK